MSASLPPGSHYRNNCYLTSGSKGGGTKHEETDRRYPGKNQQVESYRSQEATKKWLDVSYMAALKEMTIYPKVRLDDLRFGAARGGYVLILALDAKKNIQVGSLGVVSFLGGFYAYLGSALGGFKSRMNRHLTEDKKPKWHIDYLLSEANVLQVILCETERRLECLLSRTLINEFSCVPGFGCSDCRCKSHLYFANDRHHLESDIRRAIAEVALPQESLKEARGLSDRNEADYFNYRWC